MPMKQTIAAAIAALLLLAPFGAGARADDGARCTALAQKWQKAKVEKASNPKFARAKVWAASAARDCAKAKSDRQSDGASEYIEALKLVGIVVH